MQLFGYGEDGLTMWALRDKLPDLLMALGDDSQAENCLVFFRPSFGRGANCFGEFDAILATERKTYLIESKWDSDGAITARRKFRLEDCQPLRHIIFRWIRSRWGNHEWPDWGQFVKEVGADFSGAFAGRVLPKPTTLLARNLRFVMTQLSAKPVEMEDILLFSTRNTSDIPTAVVAKGTDVPLTMFRIVPFRYHPHQPSSLFTILPAPL
jgi:hypothetical protein